MAINDDVTKKIISDVKICFENIGLSIAAEEEGENQLSLYSEIEDDFYTMRLKVTFCPIVEIIVLYICFLTTAPPEAREVLCELANLINKLMLTDYVTICSDTGAIMFHTSMLLAESSLDKDQFDFVLGRILTNSLVHFRLLCSQVYSELSPQENLERFMEENKDLYS